MRAEAAIDLIQCSSLLKACSDGTISRAAIEGWMVQDGIISRNFLGMIIAVMSSLRNLEDIAPLAENLYEECGEGNLARAHSRLKLQLAESCGIPSSIFLSAEPTPATQFHLDHGFAACRSGSAGLGLGYLWGNERLVPYEYSILKDGTLLHFPDADQEFFRVNIESDVGHANAIDEIASTLLKTPGEEQAFELGVEMATTCRLVFYEGVLSAAMLANEDSR